MAYDSLHRKYKGSIKYTPRLLSKFSKVVSTLDQNTKSITFPHTNNEHMEIGILKYNNI